MPILDKTYFAIKLVKRNNNDFYPEIQKLNLNGIIGKTIRSHDWWHYKTPLVLAAAFGAALNTTLETASAAIALGQIVWYVIALGSFGYALNDLCDIQEDRAAGKPNQMARLSPWQRVAVVAMVTLGGALPILWHSSSFAITVCLLNYTLPVLYSVKPVRLKEKGILGVVADSLGAHVLPALYAIALVYSRVGADNGAGFANYALVFCALTSLIGLRGILNHMCLDKHNDEVSGVSTFIMRFSEKRIERLLKVSLFLEFVFVLWLAVAVPQAAMTIIFGLVIYCSLALLKYYLGWTWQYSEQNTSKQLYKTPLQDNGFYQTWLPLLMLLGLIQQDIAWLLLCWVFIGLFWPNYAEEIRQFNKLVSQICSEIFPKYVVPGYEAIRWGLMKDPTNAGKVHIAPCQDKYFAAVISLKNGGQALWDTKLRLPGRYLKPETSYAMVFSAKAGLPAQIVAGCWQDRPPWDNLGFYERLDLNDRWQSFQLPFTTARELDCYYLGFWLGSNDDTTICMTRPKLIKHYSAS